MLFKRIFIGCILLLCSCYVALSQRITDSIKLNLETLTINEGLSQGMVRSIIQDKEGFMWFATKDGLNRYDGYQMKVYRHNATDSFSLPDNYVTQLAEDSFGNFWVGTSSKGLCILDKKTEQFHQVRMPASDKTSIMINKIILRTEGMFIDVMDNAYFLSTRYLQQFSQQPQQGYLKPTIDFSKSYTKNFPKQASFHGKFVTWLPDGTFWFWRNNNMVTCKPNDSYSSLTFDEQSMSAFGLPNPADFFTLTPNRNNHTCLLRMDMVYGVYDYLQRKVLFLNKFKDFFSFYSNESLLPDTYYITIDNENYEYNTEKNSLKYLLLNNEIGQLTGGCTFKDRNNVLWIGTNGHGIIKLDPKKQNFHSIEELDAHMNRNHVGSSLFIKKGRPLEYHAASNTFSELFPKKYFSQKGYAVSSLIQDADSNYWVKGAMQNSSSRFIASYNKLNGTLKEYHCINQFPKQFESMFSDSKKNLWMIYTNPDGYNRLRLLDKVLDTILKEFVFPVKRIFGEYSFVSDWWEDAKHVFWFATTQGLLSLDVSKNQWKHWKHQARNSKSLSNNVLFSICPDPIFPEKHCWLGSNGGGLNRFEFANETFTHYGEKDGLPNQVVYGILSDKQHNLWLSTNKGISCFNPSRKSFLSFREQDGLVGDEFNRYEFQKASNGDLYFGGINGFVYFTPEEVLQTTGVANIKLTGLTVFNNTIDYKQHPAMLAAPIEYAKTITLRSDENMFSIEFAYLNYTSATTKKYQYKLEGFHKDWIANGAKNFASFTNLDPGKYTFQVMACNIIDLKWSLPVSIQIIILPPWWGTWWFRLLVALLIAVIGYFIVHYRYLQNLRLLTLRNRIADDLHDEIGSTLSSISLSSTIIQHKIKDESKDVKHLLTQISNHTDNMMEAMSDIIWTINTRNDSFESLLLRMRTFAIEILEPKHYAIHFEIDEGMKKIKLDIEQRKNFYLIYKETIHNISKYANANNVWIDMSLSTKNTLLLKIRDDGIGFDSTNGNALGGNGIYSMKKRAKELNGALKINSMPKQGTEIVLQFDI